MRINFQGIEPNEGGKDNAGNDLYLNESGVLRYGEFRWLGTYTKISINQTIPNTFGLVLPRSSMAKHKLQFHPGIIDPTYQGEIKIGVLCHNPEGWSYKTGDRIAQIVFVRFIPVEFNSVKEFKDSSRGESGFGSTGK